MNVLIVDDQRPVRVLLSRWLAGLGHTILDAPDADTALAMIEQHSIAVVLCDRAMPGHDGDWLVGQLRERFPAIAIILATGDGSVPARISLRDGVVGYLVKPFKRELVLDAVNDAIAWHQAAAAAPSQLRSR